MKQQSTDNPKQKWNHASSLNDLIGWVVFNDTFNNISVILWWSVLLVEKTWVSGKYYRPAASNWQTLSHNVVSSTPRLNRILTHNISSDRQGSYKSNYHTITTMAFPISIHKFDQMHVQATEMLNYQYISQYLSLYNIHNHDNLQDLIHFLSMALGQKEFSEVQYSNICLNGIHL